MRDIDRVTILGENAPDQVCYALVILGNQNTNRTNSSWEKQVYCIDGFAPVPQHIRGAI
jgi:hypothetical protein